jgi:hypothetical protein
MNFTDAQLQACYERNFAASAEVAEEVREVRALIAAHDVFLMMEGPHSSRVHEAIDRLLRPGLRFRLHRWYQRAGADLDPAAIEFRDRLSHLAGERLEAGYAP